MKHLTLTRFPHAKCTLGRLSHGIRHLCYILEPIWADNLTNISSIPVGTYRVYWHESPRFGWVWKLADVPGRTEILIHKGNYPRDTQGCLLPGIGVNESTPMVTQSGSAFNLLNAELAGDKEWELTIMDGTQ